jgi:hypothetical protein
MHLVFVPAVGLDVLVLRDIHDLYYLMLYVESSQHGYGMNFNGCVCENNECHAFSRLCII